MESHPQPPLSNRGESQQNHSLQILVSGDTPEDPLSQAAQRALPLLEELACELYDEQWPAWRTYEAMELSLQFLDSEAMAELNSQYRAVNGPTDVLTFPLYELEGRFVPPQELWPLSLGDIILCSSVIQKNAEEHSVAPLSELALVVFHGMLHLLAWDHDTPERERTMWAVQQRYRDLFLERFALLREAD